MNHQKKETEFENSFQNFLLTCKACLFSRLAEPLGYTLFAVSGILITWGAGNVSLSGILSRSARLFPAWFFVVASVYVFNDIFDMELDRENNLSRPLAEGNANSRHAIYLFILLFTSGLVLSLTISFTMAIVSLTFIGLGIMYSLPSIRIKKVFLGKSLTLSTGFSLSVLAGGVASRHITHELIFVTSCIFAFIFFTSPLADLKDIDGDKKENIKTFPNIIGQKNTLLIGILSYLMLPFLSLVGNIFLDFNYLYTLFLSLISAVNIKKIFPLWKNGASQGAYKKLRNFQILTVILVALIFFLETI
ncbi:hypothetical protein AKJ49_02195 [candidate division MSBL1 archaeon SCGC-AAA382A03]|uniref:Ubiquinone biosynthesis protein UbiA n=1 Tax=candidate division MSBL1 archaeon SCGC-AAA382A03 TaxID=1698278 RepID=A0A133VD22_9EURY|nr:hypothetical protein AKJ49_02195 [candidate division MSBL1 archaeon SCGC-AAA382A03]